MNPMGVRRGTSLTGIEAILPRRCYPHFALAQFPPNCNELKDRIDLDSASGWQSASECDVSHVRRGLQKDDCLSLLVEADDVGTAFHIFGVLELGHTSRRRTQPSPPQPGKRQYLWTHVSSYIPSLVQADVDTTLRVQSLIVYKTAKLLKIAQLWGYVARVSPLMLRTLQTDDLTVGTDLQSGRGVSNRACVGMRSAEELRMHRIVHVVSTCRSNLSPYPFGHRWNQSRRRAP